jgi:hypothetical protein
MPEAAFFVDLIKAIGFPAVIFVIWHLYHKSQVRAWKEVNDIHTEETREMFNKLFTLTDNCLETIQYNATVMARLIEKIEGNQFCPLIKEGRGK